MKLNMSVRIKNPWFWVSIIGTILTAMGINPEMLTSWDILLESIRELFRNPFMLGSVCVTILGIFIDPTTAGINDSEQAMTYSKPRKDT